MIDPYDCSSPYLLACSGYNLPPGCTDKHIQEHYDPEPEPPDLPDYGTLLEDELVREVWRKEVNGN